ncbi:histidine phosphatase family protein [Pseudonocardia sp. MH-G8]|uniref:histidine phosphatase family protein n=1 Tax=Pseudonocardia sp. MH-G8 TaxID=1854588 RepID=UPI0013041D3C|nr:histidine phosphatase family protein [Pseudonocardia sp. MH-G8]
MNTHSVLDDPDLADWRAVRVVLVRHGESQGNAAARFEGQTGPGLTPRGHAQARAIADGLVGRHGAPDLVLASDLVRVSESAAPHLARTGLAARVDPRWREAAVGTWSGRGIREIAAEFPDAIRALRRGEDVRRGGGETFAEVRVRVAAALDDALAPFAGTPVGSRHAVVVFTHGGPVRVATAEAMALPAGGHRGLDAPTNCSATELEFVLAGDGSRTTRLVAYNTPAPTLPEEATCSPSSP